MEEFRSLVTSMESASVETMDFILDFTPSLILPGSVVMNVNLQYL